MACNNTGSRIRLRMTWLCLNQSCLLEMRVPAVRTRDLTNWGKMAIILHFNIHFLVWKLLYFIKMQLNFLSMRPINENDHALNTRRTYQTTMAWFADVYMRHWSLMSYWKLPAPWASYQIRKMAGCACAVNAGNVFPRSRFQRKPLVSDPGMHHG